MFKKLYVLMAKKQDDGSDISGADVVGTGNDARVAMLNLINDQNDEANADQFVGIVDIDKGITEPFTVKKADGTRENLTDTAVHEKIVDHDADKTVVENVKPVVKENLSGKHKIKINGIEQELPLEEIIARAQKVTSADQYLAEAAKIRNELEARKLPDKTDADLQTQSDEEALALARAIQMGSEEEAVAAIRKITSLANVQKGPSNDDLARTIDERLTFNEALSKFNNEYSDLVSDKFLHKMVLDRDSELIAQGDRRSYYERYKEIGDEVRGWVKQFKPAETTKQETDKTQVDKVARKADAPTVPNAAGGKTVNSTEEEKEETASEVIAGIAAARGGPQWMKGLPTTG